jgi:hypothetical protein
MNEQFTITIFLSSQFPNLYKRMTHLNENEWPKLGCSPTDSESLIMNLPTTILSPTSSPNELRYERLIIGKMCDKK